MSPRSNDTNPDPRLDKLHRYAIVCVVWILLLIFFGGQVKSTESGLSVPDWPNTYGHFMFTFPFEKWVGGVFWEHSHRLIASVAGLFTLILSIWVLRVDRRSVVRTLAWVASIAVIVQGIFGGLTVILLLPAWTSIVHGTLAQMYLCIVAAIAVMTSRSWRLYRPATNGGEAVGSLGTLAIATTLAVFAQLLIGAVMRHTEAGLAIPDFPLMYGSWIPPLSSEAISAANKELWQMNLPPVDRWQMISHLLHRLGALVVTLMVLLTFIRAWRQHRGEGWLVRPAFLLVLLVAIQITLGILVILTQKHFIITSTHVTVGAMTLLTSFVLALRAFRGRSVALRGNPASVIIEAEPAVRTDEVAL